MPLLHEMFFHREGVSVSQLPSEEIADILLNLKDSVFAESQFQFSPETIYVGEDNKISFLPDANPNMYYTAPEVLMEGTLPNQNTALFSLGLVFYFMLHGRSYYEDTQNQLVSLPEKVLEGGSLIAGVSVGSNVERLYYQFMEKATAFKPSDREGCTNFVNAIVESFPSAVEVTFVYQGTVIGKSRIQITSSEQIIRKGTIVESRDGKRYAVMEDAHLKRRAGLHSSVITVESVSTQENTTANTHTYLMIQETSQRKATRLFELANQEQKRDVLVTCETAKRYHFLTVTADDSQQRVVDSKRVYNLNVPQQEGNTRLLLRIRYTPRNGCSVMLLSEDGGSVLSNELHFDV